MTARRHPRAPDRRRMLIGMGATGAALAMAPGLLRQAAPASAWPHRPISPGIVARAQQATPDITLDTLSAIVAFVCPGDDAWSVHQQVSLAEPGGVAAEAPELVRRTLDSYFPVPEGLAFLVETLQAELAAVPLPEGLTALTWLDGLLEGDGTVPLSPLVAAIVNLLAVAVQPASVAGPFATPFARLTWAEKAEVWRRFEGELPNLFTPGVPETRLPVVSTILGLLASIGGLLRFASGAVLEIATFASYAEFGVFDPATRTLTGRPVGWELAGYDTDEVVAGWDELIGYYQGRTSADA